MSDWIDRSLYPDRKPPAEIIELADRVDFLVRLCAAWDFGVLPSVETVAEIRGAGWRPAVDAARLLTSPVYHLLRRWHGLKELPYLGAELPYIRDDPNLGYV